MERPPRGFPGIPDHVHDALDAFTDEELAGLQAWYHDNSGLFQCVGFIGPGGKVTRYADPVRAAALEVLDNEMLKKQPWIPPYNSYPWMWHDVEDNNG